MSVSLTCAQVREVDRIAIEELGIPGIVLMENAALGATAVALELLGGSAGPVAILCGAGNNGGDGYAVARLLSNRSVEVVLYDQHPAEKLRGDALTNRTICERLGLASRDLREDGVRAGLVAELSSAALIVDGLLGTGFRGDVRAPLSELIADVNEARAAGGGPVLALDVPSGLDCDTGAPANATVRADRTVTFVARKRGFDVAGSEAWTGSVVVASIGAPDGLIDRVSRVAEGPA